MNPQLYNAPLVRSLASSLSSPSQNDAVLHGR